MLRYSILPSIRNDAACNESRGWYGTKPGCVRKSKKSSAKSPATKSTSKKSTASTKTTAARRKDITKRIDKKITTAKKEKSLAASQVMVLEAQLNAAKEAVRMADKKISALDSLKRRAQPKSASRSSTPSTRRTGILSKEREVKQIESEMLKTREAEGKYSDRYKKLERRLAKLEDSDIDALDPATRKSIRRRAAKRR